MHVDIEICRISFEVVKDKVRKSVFLKSFKRFEVSFIVSTLYINTCIPNTSIPFKCHNSQIQTLFIHNILLYISKCPTKHF